MRLSPEIVAAASAAALIAAIAVIAVLYYFRRRNKPDPEAQRRALIDKTGRIIEGSVTDFTDGVVIYRWSWRGVDYEASQDVRALSDRLPPDPDVLAGPVSVKFLPRDPANSIIVSERWSGFRFNGRQPTS